MEKISKSLFIDTLGLSCIENYCIGLMRSKGIPYELMFSTSYLSYSDICIFILINSEIYANFKRINRIHKIAEEYKIINLKYHKKVSLKKLNYNSYCLIKVTNDFMNITYNKISWREDHYIMSYINEKGDIYFINDNPLDERNIKDKEIKLNSGIYITFNKQNEYLLDKNEQIKIFVNDFYSKINKTFNLSVIDFENLIQIRDTIGILKISRKRIKKFLNNYMNTVFLDDYIKYIDSVYLTVEYMRIRKKIDIYKLRGLLENIQDKDDKISSIIEKVMKG